MFFVFRREPLFHCLSLLWVALSPSSSVQQEPKQEQLLKIKPEITSPRPAHRCLMCSRPQPLQLCWSIPSPPTAPHCERHKMLLVLMLASPPTTCLTCMHAEGKNSDPIDGMWTLSMFPWQQQKCLQPLSLAKIWFLWKWRRHYCVWASWAANVLILCTVQECVHIWLWLSAHMQRCSENNVHVQNWKFDGPKARTRTLYFGFGQFGSK